MIDTSRNMLYHIKNLNAENQRISQQTASGKSIDKGSENSILHSNLINIEDKLRVTEGLMLQIAKTKVMNETADSSLEEIKIALGGDDYGGGIQDDILKALNSGMDRNDKLAVATNLRGIRDNMFDRMNTRVDGEYVFTGSDTSIKTLEKDADFANNGKITFEGDGFLRKVAVQPGSYRDRGVTAYDSIFYPSTIAHAGETLTFEDGERIIDQDGHEWIPNPSNTKLQKYDHNGVVIHPPVEYDIQLKTAEFSSFDPSADPDYTNYPQSQKATYETVSTLPATEPGVVFKSMHNYFDDLNVTINALEGYATNIDGTPNLGTEMTDEQVRATVSEGLGKNAKQFDATNIGHGELGGRNNIFNIANEKLTSQKTHYDILIQKTAGADTAKLAMESKALELTYQSLYTTIGKMNKLSLLNYIN